MKTRDLSRKSTVKVTAARDTRGTRTNKHEPLSDGATAYADPTSCESCGAVFTRRTWRRDHPVNHALLERAAWAKCPACLMKSAQSGYGRVMIRGDIDDVKLAAIRRRVRNVAERAEHTQPEHRIVSLERVDGGVELLTTSQQLAHRVVHELKKTFRGRAVYRWSDSDNSLYASWHLPGRREELS